MSASKNRLLTTLSALGLVAAGAFAPIGPTAYAAEGDQVAEASPTATASLQEKVAFVQAHPTSVAAQKIVAQLVIAIAAMPPAAQAAALAEIAAMGGFPSDVPGIANTPFGAANTAAAFDAAATGATSGGGQYGPASVY